MKIYSFFKLINENIHFFSFTRNTNKKSKYYLDDDFNDCKSICVFVA